MKKLVLRWLLVFSVLFCGFSSLGFVDAQNIWKKHNNTFGSTQWLKGSGSGSHIKVYWATTDTEVDKDDGNWGGLIKTIKKFINWTLGILSLIALIILLRGGFQMLTAAGDEGKFKKWFTILKQAGIALAFIAFSWMMVSLIFYVIEQASATTPPKQ